MSDEFKRLTGPLGRFSHFFFDSLYLLLAKFLTKWEGTATLLINLLQNIGIVGTRTFLSIYPATYGPDLPAHQPHSINKKVFVDV